MSDNDELKLILGGLLEIAFPEELKDIKKLIIYILEKYMDTLKKSNICEEQNNVLNGLMISIERMIQFEIEKATLEEK